MAFKIKSQLSENQIESDVSSYLGYITPIWSKRFRLISVDEQLTGADKLFNRFVPIFMQFKVSQGLNTRHILRYSNNRLGKIIWYRNFNYLSGNPILYFQLRRQAKTATDLQHNILFKLNNPPFQYSLYVAPLTLNLAEYESQLNGDSLMKYYRFNPFKNQNLDINDSSAETLKFLGLNPFLRHHVSIPPHKMVSHHYHHYSYSISGGDVVWHGGELLNGDFRLSTQLLKIINDSFSREIFGINQNQFSEFIDGFERENRIYDYQNSFFINESEKIFYFAKNLREKFGIKIILLTSVDSDDVDHRSGYPDHSP